MVNALYIPVFCSYKSHRCLLSQSFVKTDVELSKFLIVMVSTLLLFKLSDSYLSIPHFRYFILGMALLVYYIQELVYIQVYCFI